MNVKLIAHTPDPMRVIEEAACICYRSTPSEDYRIAKACAKSGHMSVYEHASFTFRIEDISRSLLAQLTRHRHASFSVQSQRYVDLTDDVTFIMPKAFRDGSSDIICRQLFLDVMEDAFYKYGELRAYGAAPEDARAVLPNATTTELVLTMNARALIEASRLRLCSRAQDEIRTLFYKMRQCIGEVCPEVAQLMVPACEVHEIPFCGETKSCGRHPKLKDIVKGEI